MLCFS